MGFTLFTLQPIDTLHCLELIACSLSVVKLHWNCFFLYKSALLEWKKCWWWCISSNPNTIGLLNIHLYSDAWHSLMIIQNTEAGSVGSIGTSRWIVPRVHLLHCQCECLEEVNSDTPSWKQQTGVNWHRVYMVFYSALIKELTWWWSVKALCQTDSLSEHKSRPLLFIPVCRESSELGFNPSLSVVSLDPFSFKRGTFQSEI